MNAGAGSAASSSAAIRLFLPLRGAPPCTVTKLGQKPLTQLKSLLQLHWSISRLRPNSVSFGSTDTQKLFTPAVAAAFADQRVDHHALLRIGDLAALAAAALLGGAGLVVDQDAETPFTSRRRFCTSSSSRAVEELDAGREDLRLGPLLDVVADHHDRLHALGAHLVRDLRHVSVPSTGWPPVIATASL